MRVKQLGWLLVALLFVLACSSVQGLAPAPTTAPPEEVTAAPQATPTTAPSVAATTGQGAVYELFDESPAPDRFTVVRVGSSQAALADVLRAESKKAAAMGRHPYAEFYADWCGPCQAIKKYLGDARMTAAFAGTYIIKLNWDDWKPKLPDAGFDVPVIPAFFEVDNDGKPTGRTITGSAWREDTPENIAPPLQRFFHGG